MSKVKFAIVNDNSVLSNVKIPNEAAKIDDKYYTVIDDWLLTVYIVDKDKIIGLERYPLQLFTSDVNLRVLKLNDGESIDNIIIDNFLVQVLFTHEVYEMSIFEKTNNGKYFNFKFMITMDKVKYGILKEDVFRYFTRNRKI